MKMTMLVFWTTGLLIACQCALASTPQPLPNDLKWVSPDALPKHASWFSIQRWPQGYPPEPYNWCAGRTDVVYYHSASYSTNNIFIDDSTVDYSQETTSLMASSPSVSFSGGGQLGPQYGPSDLWLEIKRYSTNQVSVLLHGATNGVWELLSKTNLAQANLKWQLQEMQIDDGTTNTLYFGPYPDAAPFIEFYRAELATNLFTVVATNLPSPVGVDYQGAIQSLILPINYFNNYPYSFGVIDTNGVLSNWSTLSEIDAAAEIRIATAKATGFGFTNGDTFFSSGLPYGQTPATIGWLSPDGSSSDPNWLIITNDPFEIEGLYLDRVGGVWSNDLFAVSGADYALADTNLNVWRVHYRTNVQLVASFPAEHLEGILTLPNDSRYGPFTNSLITADENTRTVFAVSSTGSVSNFDLGFDADTVRLIPTNQDLYCVQFSLSVPVNLLKIPAAFFYHWQGDLLFEQSGEIKPDHPLLVIVHWNGTSFETHSIDLFTFFPDADTWLEKCSFAPISLPPIP